MDKKREKFKKKILKCYQKYLNLKNNPYTLKPHAFLSLPVIALLLLTVTGLVLNFWLSLGTMMAVTALAFLGALNYSTIANNGHLEKLEMKLLELDYDFFEKFCCNRESNILMVPEDKIEAYLDGKYELKPHYYTTYKDKVYLLSVEEMELLRLRGYEFCKDCGLIKMITPEEIEAIKREGGRIEKEGTFAEAIEKDGKRIFFKQEVVIPLYERPREEEEKSRSLIRKMIESREKSTADAQANEDNVRPNSSNDNDFIV